MRRMQKMAQMCLALAAAGIAVTLAVGVGCSSSDDPTSTEGPSPEVLMNDEWRITETFTNSCWDGGMEVRYARVDAVNEATGTIEITEWSPDNGCESGDTEGMTFRDGIISGGGSEREYDDEWGCERIRSFSEDGSYTADRILISGTGTVEPADTCSSEVWSWHDWPCTYEYEIEGVPCAGDCLTQRCGP